MPRIKRYCRSPRRMTCWRRRATTRRCWKTGPTPISLRGSRWRWMKAMSAWLGSLKRAVKRSPNCGRGRAARIICCKELVMIDFFEFQLRPRVLYKPGLVNEVGQEVAQLGARRALIVADEGVTRAGLLDRVLEGLAG